MIETPCILTVKPYQRFTEAEIFRKIAFAVALKLAGGICFKCKLGLGRLDNHALKRLYLEDVKLHLHYGNAQANYYQSAHYPI